MKFFIKNKKFILFLIFINLFVFVSMVLATNRPSLLTAWPPSPVGTQLTITSTVTDLIKYLYEWGIALGGLIAFIALLIAGFLYLTSVGDPGKMKEAVERIKSAFLGLILLLGSWLILHTINPELTTLRPLGFGLDFGLACDTNADCPTNHICVKNIIAGEGEKTGICVSETEVGHEPQPCEFVILYTDPNFHARPRVITDPADPQGLLTIEVKGGKKVERSLIESGKIVLGGERYRSGRPFRKITEEEKEERNRRGDGRIADNQYTFDEEGQKDPNGNYAIGGACSLQLFGGALWGFFCGDRIGETLLPHHDFSQLMDRRISCIRILCRARIIQ